MGQLLGPETDIMGETYFMSYFLVTKGCILGNPILGQKHFTRKKRSKESVHTMLEPIVFIFSDVIY